MEKQFPASPVIVPEWIDLVKSLSTFPNEPLSVAARTQWTYRVLRATLKSQGKCDPLDVTKEEAAGVSLTVVHFVCSGHVCKMNTGKSLRVRGWKVLMNSLKKKKTHNYWRKATLRWRFQSFIKNPGNGWDSKGASTTIRGEGSWRPSSAWVSEAVVLQAVNFHSGFCHHLG